MLLLYSVLALGQLVTLNLKNLVHGIWLDRRVILKKLYCCVSSHTRSCYLECLSEISCASVWFFTTKKYEQANQ